MIPHWKMINYYMLRFRCSLFVRWEFVSPHVRLIRHNPHSWSSSIAQIRVSTIMDDLSPSGSKDPSSYHATAENKTGMKRIKGWGEERIRANALEFWALWIVQSRNLELSAPDFNQLISTTSGFWKGWHDVRHISDILLYVVLNREHERNGKTHKCLFYT